MEVYGTEECPISGFGYTDNWQCWFWLIVGLSMAFVKKKVHDYSYVYIYTVPPALSCKNLTLTNPSAREHAQTYANIYSSWM